MKILDLNYPPGFSKNLQKNILMLKKLYGQKFIIKDGELELPAHLYLVVEPNNKKLKYYSLIYDLEDRDNWLLPFKIAFLDMSYDIDNCDNNSNQFLNNNCYIANIHKTDKITGSTMVTLVIKLLKVLHAEKVTLHDGAHINCYNSESEIDLSFFKLLEKGITFYQKFGFKFKMTKQDITSYGSTSNMMKTLRRDLDNIHKIKLEYYKDAYIKILDIINNIIKNQDYENVKIYLHHPYKPYLVQQDKVKDFVLSTVKDIDTLLNIIKNSKRKYLVELMIDLLYADCSSYLVLEDLIFKNRFAGIKYKNKGIYLKHHNIFRNLQHIRNNAIFEIVLN